MCIVRRSHDDTNVHSSAAEFACTTNHSRPTLLFNSTLLNDDEMMRKKIRIPASPRNATDKCHVTDRNIKVWRSSYAWVRITAK